jgi:hypothetical protein
MSGFCDGHNPEFDGVSGRIQSIRGRYTNQQKEEK